MERRQKNVLMDIHCHARQGDGEMSFQSEQENMNPEGSTNDLRDEFKERKESEREKRMRGNLREREREREERNQEARH